MAGVAAKGGTWARGELERRGADMMEREMGKKIGRTGLGLDLVVIGVWVGVGARGP